MDCQSEQLLLWLNAERIEETEDRVLFKIGPRQQEIHKDFL